MLDARPLLSNRACLVAALLALTAPADTRAIDTGWELGKVVVGKQVTGQAETQVNKRLLDESKKNQCSFRTDSDELAPGCDPKAKRLATAIVDAKKRLNGAGVQNFKFEVSGHTDTSGSANHNKELSERRAAAMKKQLVKQGIPEGDVIAVGMGSEKPLVKPDDTPAKKAKNRRYEVRVRL